MLTRHHVGGFAAVHGHAQPFGHVAQQFGAALLMANVPGQHMLRRGALAKIMCQAGKAHHQRRVQPGGHVQHHHQVHAGVHLGVVQGRLGHAPQARHFGQQHLQRPALAQHLEHARGLCFHQAARQFLPHALGHQVVHLAVLHHLAHQLHGFRGHGEVGKTRRKAGHAQDAHRVFAERVGHMPQQPGLQVLHAVVWVK